MLGGPLDLGRFGKYAVRLAQHTGAKTLSLLMRSSLITTTNVYV